MPRLDPFVNTQRSRVRRVIAEKYGSAIRVIYEGLFPVENEALYDVFSICPKYWDGSPTGLPEYWLVDVTGTSIRHATHNETLDIMGSDLEKRYGSGDTKL